LNASFSIALGLIGAGQACKKHIPLQTENFFFF